MNDDELILGLIDSNLIRNNQQGRNNVYGIKSNGILISNGVELSSAGLPDFNKGNHSIGF